MQDRQEQDDAVRRRPARWGASIGLALALLIGVAGPVLALSQDDDGASELVGEYGVAITEIDIPQDLPVVPALSGQWRIALEDDGSYVLERTDVGVLINGSYQVDGDQIILTDEGGLLSCANARSTVADLDPVTGVYTWTFEDEALVLVPEEEGCALRSILLSSRPLVTFIACLTEPFDFAANNPADGDATPDPDDEPITSEDEAAEADEDEATPDNPLDQLAGRRGNDESDADADADSGGEVPPEDEIDAGVDELLRQVTACWATGDPARLIPLFGEGLRAELVDGIGTIEDVAVQLEPLLTVPLTFERAGDLRLTDDTIAVAVVVVQIEDEESFQRFEFSYEDGRWLLNSLGEQEQAP